MLPEKIRKEVIQCLYIIVKEYISKLNNGCT
jgi:hypothetical protein